MEPLCESLANRAFAVRVLSTSAFFAAALTAFRVSIRLAAPARSTFAIAVSCFAVVTLVAVACTAVLVPSAGRATAPEMGSRTSRPVPETNRVASLALESLKVCLNMLGPSVAAAKSMTPG